MGANVTIADCVFSNQASTALLSTVVKSDQIPQIETKSYAKIGNETVPKIIIHDTIAVSYTHLTLPTTPYV